jgi:hypothetical protein
MRMRPKQIEPKIRVPADKRCVHLICGSHLIFDLTADETRALALALADAYEQVVQQGR